MSSSDDGSAPSAPRVGYSERAGTEGDPTGTYRIQQRYAERLRARWADVKGAVRRRIVKKDRYGFTDSTVADEVAIAVFIAWLLNKAKNAVLSVVSLVRNPFIRAGYQTGVRNALRELLAAPGFDVSDSEVPEVVRLADGGETPRESARKAVGGPTGVTGPRPAGGEAGGPAGAAAGRSEHSERLNALIRQSYRKIRDNVMKTVQSVRSYLTERSLATDGGLSNRSDIAETVNTRIDKVGRTGVSRIAATDVVSAHSAGVIQTVKRSALRSVTVRVEWVTAGDSHVCPICRALEGTKYRVDSIRSETFRYEAGPDEPPSLSGVYPVVPPIHPRCRCALIPALPSAYEIVTG